MNQQNIEKKQFNIPIDGELDAEIDEIVSTVPNLTKTIYGNAALREKVRKDKRKIERGERIAVTI